MVCRSASSLTQTQLLFCLFEGGKKLEIRGRCHLNRGLKCISEPARHCHVPLMAPILIKDPMKCCTKLKVEVGWRMEDGVKLNQALH